MKLWIDDIRPAPDASWDIARSYDEAIDKLTNFKYETVSFDHDLGDFKEGRREMTGYDIILWIVQQKVDGKEVPHSYNVHSANAGVWEKMRGTIDRYLSS